MIKFLVFVLLLVYIYEGKGAFRRWYARLSILATVRKLGKSGLCVCEERASLRHKERNQCKLIQHFYIRINREIVKIFQNARWKENQTFRGASSVFFRGLKAFWLSDFKPITEREHSLHLKHLLVSLSLHAYFEKRSLDFHRLENGRLPKPFLRVPLRFVRPLFRKGWNFVSFDQDKWLFKLSLLLKMLLNAFYKYVPEWGGRYGKKRATSCQFIL